MRIRCAASSTVRNSGSGSSFFKFVFLSLVAVSRARAWCLSERLLLPPNSPVPSRRACPHLPPSQPAREATARRASRLGLAPAAPRQRNATLSRGTEGESTGGYEARSSCAPVPFCGPLYGEMSPQRPLLRSALRMDRAVRNLPGQGSPGGPKSRGASCVAAPEPREHPGSQLEGAHISQRNGRAPGSVRHSLVPSCDQLYAGMSLTRTIAT